ncbi:fibronectin type III domain-containing protein [Nonomuraea sp. 10N515B]|uniref:fibronectin type III domain-containing protein n=1 Tax=Nonomuraea sp. 10N515B TaxID=3457422 RepID=UPI003FCC5703
MLQKMLRALVVAVLLTVGGTAPPAAADPGGPGGSEPTADQAATASASRSVGQYVPLDLPERMVDTGAGGVAAGGTVTRKLAGSNGIPAEGVVAVAAHVAVGSPPAAGSLRAWAAGDPVPQVTTVAFDANVQWSSAHAMIRLNAAGEASFLNNSTGNVRVVVDVNGYYVRDAVPEGLRFVPAVQSRILNTKEGVGVSTTTPVGPNSSITFQVAGKGGLPAASQIGAVVLNVTAVQTTATGSWQVYPAGSSPRYGHGHFVAGRHKSNTVITKLSTDGRLSLRNAGQGSTHYLADVVGYYRAAPSAVPTSGVIPVKPQRVLDTAADGGPIPAKGTKVLRVGGTAGVPQSGVSGVALLLSARGSAHASFLTVYPGGTSAPDPSSVQFPANGTGFNLVWTKTSDNGTIRIYNGSASPVQVWGDLYAYAEAATKPDAPTQVKAEAGDKQVTVSWQKPFDGGTRITGYTVTAYPWGRTATTTGATTATVTGLDNGTAYTFTVTATNSLGTSPPSAHSTPAIPADPKPPGRPLITEVFPRDGEVRVSWSPPETGAAGVTEYVVAAEPGGASVKASPQETEAVVSGLDNGTVYTFTVTAANGNGSGQPSPTSEPVSPAEAEVPVKPLITAAVPLDGRIDIQWAPAADGGSAITGYTVTAEPGGRTVDTPPDTTVASVSGLTNGTAYTLSVVAKNKAGTSPAATTDPLTPDASRAPAVPTDVRASVVADGSIKVTWTAPEDTGTAPITSYTVTATGTGGKSATVTGTSATLTGLRADTGYTITIAATNTHGIGTASEATGPVMPDLSVKATPKVLSNAALNTLQTAHPDGTLDFVQPPSEITSLTPGTFIIATSHPRLPEGLFRKVTGAREMSGLFVVFTAHAGLDEVLGAGAVAYDETISAAEIRDFKPASPGVTLVQPIVEGRTLQQGAPRATRGASIGIRDGEAVISFSTSVNGFPYASLQAEAGLRPILKGGIDIGVDGVKTRLKLGAQTRANATLKAGIGGELKQTIPLGSFTTAPITIPAGPAPIVLVPELTFKATVSVNGSVGIRVSAGYSRVIAGEMRTHNATVTDFNVINEPGSSNYLDDLQAYGSVGAQAGVSVGLLLKVYGVAGPEFSAGPYVKATVDVGANPWWEVRAGISASVSLKLKLFTFELSKDWPIGDVNTVIARAPGAWDGILIQPSSADIGLNESLTLKVTANGTPPPVRWRVVSGPGTVNQDGVYTSDERGVAEIEAAPTQGDKQPARAGIRVGTRPSPPKVEVKPAPLSLGVTWPAVTPGDSPVTEYAITTHPPTSTTYVPARAGAANYSAYTGQLKLGKPYYVQVTAITAGLSSTSGWVGPTTPAELLGRLGSPTYIAADANGNPEKYGVHGFALSNNGRYAFFGIEARSNLAPPEIYDPNSTVIYLIRKDLTTGEIDLASRGMDGHTPHPIQTSFSHPSSPSYDGNSVAFITPAAGGSSERVLVHDMAELTTWEGAPASDGTAPVVAELSGNGNVLVYQEMDEEDLNADKPIWRKQRNAGRELVDPCARERQPCDIAVSVSHDGNRIVYTRRDRDLAIDQRLPMLWEGGTRTNLMQNASANEYARDPVISSDGAKVAVIYNNQRRESTAVVPITARSITEADVVVKSLSSPMDLSTNGRVMAYMDGANSTGTPRLGIADTVAKTSQLVFEFGHHGDMTVSGDGTVLGWMQYCQGGPLPCPEGMLEGPYVQHVPRLG